MRRNSNNLFMSVLVAISIISCGNYDSETGPNGGIPYQDEEVVKCFLGDDYTEIKEYMEQKTGESLADESLDMDFFKSLKGGYLRIYQVQYLPNGEVANSGGKDYIITDASGNQISSSDDPLTYINKRGRNHQLKPGKYNLKIVGGGPSWKTELSERGSLITREISIEQGCVTSIMLDWQIHEFHEETNWYINDLPSVNYITIRELSRLTQHPEFLMRRIILSTKGGEVEESTNTNLIMVDNVSFWVYEFGLLEGIKYYITVLPHNNCIDGLKPWPYFGKIVPNSEESMFDFTFPTYPMDCNADTYPVDVTGYSE